MSDLIVTDQKILRQVSEKCSLDEAKPILEKLLTVFKTTPNAAGLAAIQLGIPKRVAVIKDKTEFLEVVNPVIVDGYDPTLHTEGCLSLPGLNLPIYRNTYVIIKDDLHENKFVCQPSLSYAIQHEIDHMDGILILDREYKSSKFGRNDACPICKKKLKKCEHGDYFLKGVPSHGISKEAIRS